MINGFRDHTICFQMTENGRYWVALWRYNFTDFICDWLESVHDCNILDKKSRKTPFQKFADKSRLEFVCKSDESYKECDAEEELLKWRNEDKIYKDFG